MVTIAPLARHDLTSYLSHVALENPLAARRMADRVLGLIGDLASAGFDGPEQILRTGEVVRSWPLPPLRIYYQRTQGGDLTILRIYHQARRPITK